VLTGIGNFSIPFFKKLLDQNFNDLFKIAEAVGRGGPRMPKKRQGSISPGFPNSWKNIEADCHG